MTLRLQLTCLLALALLGGCGPSEQKKLELAEKNRVECLDKLCPGDVEPIHNRLSEVAFKINGLWYIGPRNIFNHDGRAGFEWWDHKPVFAGMKRPEEMQKLAVEGRGYDFSIEIFLSRRSSDLGPESAYQALLIEEKKGHVIKKPYCGKGLRFGQHRRVLFLKKGGLSQPNFDCRQASLPLLLVVATTQPITDAVAAFYGLHRLLPACAFEQSMGQTGLKYISKSTAYCNNYGKFNHVIQSQ